MRDNGLHPTPRHEVSDIGGAFNESHHLLKVDHTTVFRWVQRYAPEINKRMRPHLKMSGTSYRLDDTYVKTWAEWKYIYRAVATIEFMQEREARRFRGKAIL